MTAMVWAPNVGINYPFTGGGNPYPTRATDPLNFAALDTTPDGVIDYKDDPYLPFYPGDEFVDWVGISLYWYPDSDFIGPVTKNYFLDQLTGKIVNDPRTASGSLRQRDWRILTNPAVRDSYIKDLDGYGSEILLAINLNYSCDGSIKMKY